MPTVTLRVDAKTIWVDSGITTDGETTVTITSSGGTWTANPANGLVDANGHPGLVAKPRYTLEGELEGALIGRIVPASAPEQRFLIGAGPTDAPRVAGRLSLAINDDVDHIYGVGFPDNEGVIDVEIQY